MENKNFVIHCPHCNSEINFEKAINVFDDLTEACNLNREKLFYICQLHYDFEMLKKIKTYKEELVEEFQNTNTKQEKMLFNARKLLWLHEQENEIQERFDISYEKMSLISNEIYEKLQNMEKELVHK